jgi:hypothetical protein
VLTPDFNIYYEQPDRKPDNLFVHYFFGDGLIALINALAALDVSSMVGRFF